MAKTYINMKNGREVETVDEYTTKSEAVKMLSEYRIADPYNYYYTSKRCTKGWGER